MAKDASIKVMLEFQANNASLSKATKGIANELSTLQRKTATVASSMTSFVPAFAAVGAAAFSAFSFAGRAAVQFQDSFAGVRKTLNFSGTAAKNQEENFRALADSLVDISRTTPMAANELARIGEIGGQLGISAGAITKFTKTISQLTVATTMSAEEASFALSRLAAITRLPERNLGNLASVLVRLGNEFAATEGEIVNTAMKIASALELLESPTSNAAADSLALAAALKQVGQQTQAGSTAVARSLDIMATAVLQGGRELSLFAKVAGMTSDTFRNLAEASPAQAFVAFLEGLQAVGNAGADTVQLLEELGLGQQRTLRALRSMALASDDVKDALSSANEEFALNNALQTEAEKRYETVVSQLGMLRNNITALGIETGNQLLEPLNEVIDGLTTIAGGTTSDELKRIVAGFALMATTLNGVMVARKKMLQLNQVAQGSGLMGTGVDGSISFVGDALPGRKELLHRRRARKIQGRGGSTFNRKDFLAQQAGMGRQTRGFENILQNADVMDVDVFDAQANQALFDKIGGFTDQAPEDVRFLGADGTEKSLSGAEQNRLGLLQSMNQETVKQSNELIKIQDLESSIAELKQEALGFAEEASAIEKDTASTKKKDPAKISAITDDINDLITDDKVDFSGDTEGFEKLKNSAVEYNVALQQLGEAENNLIRAENDLKNVKEIGTADYTKQAKAVDNAKNDVDKFTKQVNENGQALKDNVKNLDTNSGEVAALGKDLSGLVDEYDGVENASSKVTAQQKADAEKAQASLAETTAKINEQERELKQLQATQAQGGFLTQSVGASSGIMGPDPAKTDTAFRSVGNSIKVLGGNMTVFGNETKKTAGVFKSFLRTLFMSRKQLLANSQAVVASASSTTAMKVATQGLTNAMIGLKAATISLLASLGAMVAFGAIMGYLMKLWENSKKTAAAIREIGDEIKGVIDLQDELVFSNLQRGLIEDALENEMRKRSPDQTLIKTFQQQLSDMDEGINQAKFNIEENMAEIGKALLLETTEDGVNVEARLEGINQALGNTFDLNEFFVEVGKQISDFESGTTKTLLRTLQNLEETQDEIDSLRAGGATAASSPRLAALEEEIAVFEVLREIQRQTGSEFENFLKDSGDVFGINFQDTFSGSILGSEGALSDNITKNLGMNFEKLADGSIQIFKEIETGYTSMYGAINSITREPIAIIAADIFKDADDNDINMEKVLDDLSAYIILAETLRAQATGKDASRLSSQNSTFIKMQNEGLIKQMQFLKANGVIMQDVDPFKDRKRAIQMVSNATRVYQNQQIQKAQQSANSLGILEFQMSKFEKALNESLQRSAGTLASVFSEIPITVRKGVDEMLNEMVIKEARLKNFQNDIKRLSTIAPMLAKNLADQGLAARQMLSDLLSDPVAAFSMEASMNRIAPFQAEQLGLSEEEIERMQDAGLRLGDSASEGIIIGIQNRQAELERVLISSVKNAIDATAYYIKEGSPSKLTMEILGEPIGQGIALGIENEEGKIKDTMIRVVENAIEETELLLMETSEGISELSRALTTMFAVTAGKRALTAANYTVQKSEQALMATRRKNATLQERITKNQIALQKAELEGRKNNITMSEEMNILQQKVAIDEMKRTMSGKKTASERKSIANAEKELEELRLAAEAGIVDALDVEVAEEKLADLKGTNKSIEEQRIQILQLAEAEKKLQETEKEAREVDEQLIALREENVKLLDEAANKSFELQTAYDNLEASTEGVFNAEMKYAEARDKFDKFVKASPDLFDALIQGYGGVGSTIDGITTKTINLVNNTVTGADRAVLALQTIVTEANKTAAHLTSLDLLANTTFESAPDEAMDRRNTVGTASEFLEMFRGTPLEGIINNFKGTSATGAGRTSAMDRTVFKDIDDFMASEQALSDARAGKKITFSDFSRALQSYLGVATNVDTAGNINFAEEQLEGLGIADTAGVAQAKGIVSNQNFGTAVLGASGDYLTGEMNDLSRLAPNERIEYNYSMSQAQQKKLGFTPTTYDVTNINDLVKLFDRATGTSGNSQEKVLEALGMKGLPGKLGDPNKTITENGMEMSTSLDHLHVFQRDRNKQNYKDTLLGNVSKLLDTLGEGRYEYLLKRKYGGGMKPFQRALVGEYGPEMVTALPQGGLRVTPQGSERGGSISINSLNVNVTGVPTDPVQARKAAVQIQKALVKLDKEGVSGTGLSRR
jgi:TP901 family phage tail tape measure protein